MSFYASLAGESASLRRIFSVLSKGTTLEQALVAGHIFVAAGEASACTDNVYQLGVIKLCELSLASQCVAYYRTARALPW